MLFFFKRNVVVVDCFITNPTILKLFPIAKASHHIPDWWKRMPQTNYNEKFISNESTLKGCPGFIDLYKQGFMMPLWADLAIDVKDGKYQWQFSDFSTHAEVHNSHQWGAFADESKYGHIKILSPWRIKTKKDLSWLMLAPFWNDKLQTNYSIVPGVLNFKYQHENNINIFISMNENNFIIPNNHPLYHLIPLTQDKVELKYHLVSEEELKKYNTHSVSFTQDYYNRISLAKKCPIKWNKND